MTSLELFGSWTSSSYLGFLHLWGTIRIVVRLGNLRCCFFQNQVWNPQAVECQISVWCNAEMS